MAREPTNPVVCRRLTQGDHPPHLVQRNTIELSIAVYSLGRTARGRFPWWMALGYMFRQTYNRVVPLWCDQYDTAMSLPTCLYLPSSRPDTRENVPAVPWAPSQYSPYRSSPHNNTWKVVQYRVQCRYNAVDFLKNTRNKHPITHQIGRAMGCLLRVQSLCSACTLINGLLNSMVC